MNGIDAFSAEHPWACELVSFGIVILVTASLGAVAPHQNVDSRQPRWNPELPEGTAQTRLQALVVGLFGLGLVVAGVYAFLG